MTRGYSRRQRQTIRVLARQYCAGRFELTEPEQRELVEHSQAFFVLLPLRMRLVVLSVLVLLRASAWFVSPVLHSLPTKPVSGQQRVYALWCGGSSYLSYLLRQMVHLTFIGSLYSLPRLHAAMGCVRREPTDA